MSIKYTCDFCGIELPPIFDTMANIAYMDLPEHKQLDHIEAVNGHICEDCNKKLLKELNELNKK